MLAGRFPIFFEEPGCFRPFFTWLPHGWDASEKAVCLQCRGTLRLPTHHQTPVSKHKITTCSAILKHTGKAGESGNTNIISQFVIGTSASSYAEKPMFSTSATIAEAVSKCAKAISAPMREFTAS